MIVEKTKLDGCLIIKPKLFNDSRGYFFESFNEKRYQEMLGIKERFVQDNCSKSTKGVLRGLHFQRNNPQGKLVYVTSGSVLDVAVDIRPNSKTYGQYESVILSSDNKLQFYVPPGFAHGFLVLSDVAEFQYKCTDYYYPDDECGIYWNDEEINIDWPITNPILSKKDKAQPSFKEIVTAKLLDSHIK
ncbi:dTDP-4-dehydrorhamnose 3,5-epimerase [Pseudoalteromonas piscicida]|nr:dTDP-4-dehydrorhamnose 3,5-epimerase [Pseudoalteromonas piscicida]WPU34600.1 dTDP-4-dehydrorhamnose 3,5-epimerase [Pseudoalteromonas piscicida]